MYELKYTVLLIVTQIKNPLPKKKWVLNINSIKILIPVMLRLKRAIFWYAEISSLFCCKLI